MVNLKYRSKQFGKMGSDELRLHAKSLLLKISIITGWLIPEDENIYRILSQQFDKKLAESFPNVNADEMEFAFRNNTQVKDWGKAMNLSLIDEVMIPYLEKRRELSEIEAQQKPKQIEYKEDLSDKSMSDWAEDLKVRLKENKITVEFLPVMVYDYLVKVGKLAPTKEQKHEYLTRAVQCRQSKLIEEANEKMTPENNSALLKFNEMKEKGVFEGDETERLKGLAKRMLLYDYLKNENGK